MRVDDEADFHGYTRAEMFRWLNATWASRRWQGMRRVRVIHGKGVVLGSALREWCEAKGIPCQMEPGNPGSTILYPNQQVTQLPSPGVRCVPTFPRPIPRSSARQNAPAPKEDRDLFQDELDRLDGMTRGEMLKRKGGA
jgi:hypothetical protein